LKAIARTTLGKRLSLSLNCATRMSNMVNYCFVNVRIPPCLFMCDSVKGLEKMTIIICMKMNIE
jgi:hypothetical protein